MAAMWREKDARPFSHDMSSLQAAYHYTLYTAEYSGKYVDKHHIWILETVKGTMSRDYAQVKTITYTYILDIAFNIKKNLKNFLAPEAHDWHDVDFSMYRSRTFILHTLLYTLMYSVHKCCWQYCKCYFLSTGVKPIILMQFFHPPDTKVLLVEVYYL